MKLKELLTNIDYECLDFEDIEIKNISCDSRNITRDSIFAAINGVNVDGNDFIQEAINKGAKVIITEKSINEKNALIITVEDTRKTLAILASNWYRTTGHKTKYIGITGTDGKTTTSEFIFSLLKGFGKSVGIISSISAKYNNANIVDSTQTTPSALHLHKYIAEMQKANVEYIIVEVTSHGLDQARVFGINFELSAITNITPEHLNYHETFEKYLNTKLKILEQSKQVLLNKYDPSLDQIIGIVKNNYEIVDYKEYAIPKKFTEKFPGTYNLQNLALALRVVEELTKSNLLEITKNIPIIKGRFEYVQKKPFPIVIDYAHTPAGLEKVLTATRIITKNRLILVFGLAGERDFNNRAAMGFIAQEQSDIAIITSDDHWSENPLEIISQIEIGVKKAGGILNKTYYKIPDREKAIKFAIKDLAKKGDTLLITGKGHEITLNVRGKDVPYSDQETVREILK